MKPLRRPARPAAGVAPAENQFVGDLHQPMGRGHRGDCGIAAGRSRPSRTIARMSDPTHLLIAFAGGGTPAAKEALRAIRLPRLERLLQRLQPLPPEPVDELAPEAPHERALARALGLDSGAGRTPWAALAVQRAGGAPGPHAWAWITPCHWRVRDMPPRSVWALEQAGMHPLLARLYAARGVTAMDELDDALARLLPPANMLGTQKRPHCWPTPSLPKTPVHRGRLRLRRRHRLRRGPARPAPAGCAAMCSTSCRTAWSTATA
jgi:hypothetical protein